MLEWRRRWREDGEKDGGEVGGDGGEDGGKSGRPRRPPWLFLGRCFVAVGDEEQKKENERERKKWGVYIRGRNDYYKFAIAISFIP